jgi:hypothetical protein
VDTIGLCFRYGHHKTPLKTAPLTQRGNLDNKDTKARKVEQKRMFYPQQDDWKRKVWQQGSGMVLKTLDCLR